MPFESDAERSVARHLEAAFEGGCIIGMFDFYIKQR